MNETTKSVVIRSLRKRRGDLTTTLNSIGKRRAKVQRYIDREKLVLEDRQNEIGRLHYVQWSHETERDKIDHALEELTKG